MDLFDTFFGELLMTFLIAMVPVLELRGAIPAGIAAGLPPAAAAAAAILGNLVPIPFLILLLRTALPAIALGVLIAGIITTTVTCGVIRVFW